MMNEVAQDSGLQEKISQRVELIAALPSEYRAIFERWSDEDVRKYVFLINTSTPQETFDRTLQPSLSGLATAIHERFEMSEMQKIFSLKFEGRLQFDVMLRSRTLPGDAVHAYYSLPGEERPRKIYLDSHRQAYRKELSFIQSQAQENGLVISKAALFATHPRLINKLGDTLNSLEGYKELFRKEAQLQLGALPIEDEFSQFPTLTEISQAFAFWNAAHSYLQTLELRPTLEFLSSINES